MTLGHTLALFCLALSATAVPAQDLAASIRSEQPQLITMYKDLHEHPELSHHEERTSAILAKGLIAAGYTVTDHIGVYPDGSKAFGVVGILKNGPGPQVLIRGDMDALPIIEETGVPYASHVITKNAAGQDSGVMHACGHDIHTTVLLGTAQALAANKSLWHGTAMIVGQPSEETIDGAKAMLADKLYARFGKPDMVIGLHDSNALPAGKIGYTLGPTLASSTSIDVIIKGIGGHGSAPNLGRDPVTLAAYYITQIQTIVSREEDPQDPAVVTVGDIHGGTKRNIIPDSVKLELTTRAFSIKARQTIIDGLTQMAAGLTLSAGLPPEKAVKVTVLDDESTPVLYNDPRLMTSVSDTLKKTLGPANVIEAPKVMGSEDVGVFGLDGKIPVAFFFIGAINPEKFAAAKGKPFPGPHTSKFEPDPAPTLATGVTALSNVAISLLK